MADEIAPLLSSRPRSLSRSYSSDRLSQLVQDKWGGTPGLRKTWSVKQPRVSQSKAATTINGSTYRGSGFYMLPHWLIASIEGLPGLLIALTLNLFLSVSFGSAFFPHSWNFPDNIPRSIGVSMFLFSTCICQLFMTTLSKFDVAIGMMMVENIPFFHTIAVLTISEQGNGLDSFATVFATLALSSILVGMAFLLLGYLKLGSAVHFIPRHCILGCIGGIGIFIFITGLEVSTNISFQIDHLLSYFQLPGLLLWATPMALEIFLRIILRIFPISVLPPFYFILIPPLFYIILFIFRIPLSTMHDQGWFFEESPPTEFSLIWKLLDLSRVDWHIVWKCFPTMLALCIFSIMHAPINIPSLTVSTGKEVDMDQELITHGYSNLVSGLLGGLQNYLCYSNSLLYFKCHGRGKVSGYLLCTLTAVFFFYGPTIVPYIPRCMAGCLLLHVGIDLTKEALVDTLGIFDLFEYDFAALYPLGLILS